MREIRFANEGDADAIRRIYAPSVTRRDVATSFEFEVPSVKEMARRVREKTRVHPWLVMEEERRVVGYAYGGPHRSRAAYQWSAEVSVYVDAGLQRRGVGRALYEALFHLLRRQGFVNLYAGITLPNAGSVGLHESLGFRLVGIYASVGFKFGRSHDVGWWQRTLQPWPSEPLAITPVRQLDVSSELENWGRSPAARG